MAMLRWLRWDGIWTGRPDAMEQDGMDKLKNAPHSDREDARDAFATASIDHMRTAAPIEADHARAPLLLDLTTVFMRAMEPLNRLLLAAPHGP